jgi:hypothetical protein
LGIEAEVIGLFFVKGDGEVIEVCSVETQIYRIVGADCVKSLLQGEDAASKRRIYSWGNA